MSKYGNRNSFKNYSRAKKLAYFQILATLAGVAGSGQEEHEPTTVNNEYKPKE